MWLTSLETLGTSLDQSDLSFPVSLAGKLPFGAYVLYLCIEYTGNSIEDMALSCLKRMLRLSNCRAELF